MTQTIAPSLESAIAALSDPPRHFLSKEEATAFVVFLLLKQPHYPSEMMRLLQASPGYDVSDTTLWAVLKRLEDDGVVLKQRTTTETSPLGGRGRPPVIFSLVPEHRATARQLALLWEQT